MKSNTIKNLVAISATLALPALADEARINSYTTQLRGVRVTELARETARLIAAEKPEARASATADAVTAAISVSSPATPLVAASVAKSSPEVAATAAATALKLQPKMAGAITKAAVSAAPSETGAIVGAMCQAQPAAFYVIGVSAANAAPKAADKILPSIMDAVPALKPLIAKARANFAAAKRPASLALVLKHTEDLLAAYSRDAKQSPESLLVKETEGTMATRLASAAVGPPPVLLPPFTPGGLPPSELTIADTTIIPESEHNYSTP